MFISIQEFRVFENDMHFSPTDLIVPPDYFHFLNTEHLSLLREEFGYVLRLYVESKSVDKTNILSEITKSVTEALEKGVKSVQS